MTKPPEPVVTGELKVTQAADEYLIRKYGMYYRPNAQGYTGSVAEAGRYTLAEAIKHSHPNGPDGPRDGIDYIPAPARHRTAHALPGDVGIFDAEPDLGATSPEPSLRKIVNGYYGAHFPSDKAGKLTAYYLAALTPSALSGDAGEGLTDNLERWGQRVTTWIADFGLDALEAELCASRNTLTKWAAGDAMPRPFARQGLVRTVEEFRAALPSHQGAGEP